MNLLFQQLQRAEMMKHESLASHNLDGARSLVAKQVRNVPMVAHEARTGAC